MASIWFEIAVFILSLNITLGFIDTANAISSNAVLPSSPSRSNYNFTELNTSEILDKLHSLQVASDEEYQWFNIGTKKSWTVWDFVKGTLLSGLSNTVEKILMSFNAPELLISFITNIIDIMTLFAYAAVGYEIFTRVRPNG